MTGDLQQVYAAQSYASLVQVWSQQTSGHMKSLIEACRLLADALEVAAGGVETMKYAVIAQLTAAATEIAADAGVAFFTGGLAALAEPALIEVQNKLLSGIMQQFESEVIGMLVDHTMGPLKEQIDRAVDKLVFEEVAHAAIGGAAPNLKLDTQAIRAHADTMGREAEGNLRSGHAFTGKVGALTFASGG